MPPWRPRSSRPLLAILSAALTIALVLPAGAAADTPPGGLRGHKYSGVDDPPTGEKPESKVWFNDGWWADMIDPASRRHHIFRLDRSTHRWVDTGVEVDPRPDAHADALWDPANRKLYIASHDFTDDASSSSSSPGRLWRFSYDRLSGYTLDPGFPVAINAARTESLVIAKDSTGVLWATWIADEEVYVNHTIGGDATWGTPYLMPGAKETSSDDLSSIIAFGGNRIGVMWSNEEDWKFYFAVHADGAGDRDWTAAPIPGAPRADDHINLKADSTGRVYAAVKHTEDDEDDPFASLLVRSPAGEWTRSTIATVDDSVTRPIVLLDEQHQRVHAVYTSGQSGGDIEVKVSPMSSIAFGAASTLIEGSSLNNATSTKQNVDGGTGLVVLASDSSAYYHADRTLGAPPVTPPPPAPAPPPPAPAPQPTPPAPPAPAPAPKQAKRRCPPSKANVARKRKSAPRGRAGRVRSGRAGTARRMRRLAKRPPRLFAVAAASPPHRCSTRKGKKHKGKPRRTVGRRR